MLGVVLLSLMQVTYLLIALPNIFYSFQFLPVCVILRSSLDCNGFFLFFFPTIVTVLSQNICGSRTVWQFAPCSSDIAKSAPNVDFTGGFTCSASWSPCHALCSHSARMANPEKQHSHINPISQIHKTKVLTKPQDIVISQKTYCWHVFYFLAWSSPPLLNRGWFCSASFQYQLHTYICALALCNSLFAGRLLCWPKCKFCCCHFFGIYSLGFKKQTNKKKTQKNK